MVAEAENLAVGIGASVQRSSSISLEVDQHYMVIEDVNLPSEMRRVVIASREQGKMTKQPAAQPSSLPLLPLSQEGIMVERVEPTPERIEPDRTISLVLKSEAALAISVPEIQKLHFQALQCPYQPLP